jgi:hypothetical protein
VRLLTDLHRVNLAVGVDPQCLTGGEVTDLLVAGEIEDDSLARTANAGPVGVSLRPSTIGLMP